MFKGGRIPGVYQYGSITAARAALATTVGGSAYMDILCPGPSTTAGYSAAGAGSNSRALSMPTKLAAAIASRKSVKAEADNSFGNAGLSQTIAPLYSSYDSRITRGDWNSYNIEGLGGLAWFQGSAGAGTPLTFTPGQDFNTIDVYWYQASAGRSFRVKNGGTTLATITTSGGSALQKTTVAVGSTISAFSLEWVSGGCYVAGWVTYSATKSVRVLNAGRGNATAGDVATNMSDDFALAGADLIVIGDPLINDAIAGTATATAEANVQTIITAAKAVCDVIYVGFNPIKTTTVSQVSQNEYMAIGKALAASNSIIYVDINERWGGSFDAAVARGFMTTDDRHPVGAGYQDTADVLAQLICR